MNADVSKVPHLWEPTANLDTEWRAARGDLAVGTWEGIYFPTIKAVGIGVCMQLEWNKSPIGFLWEFIGFRNDMKGLNSLLVRDRWSRLLARPFTLFVPFEWKDLSRTTSGVPGACSLTLSVSFASGGSFSSEKIRTGGNLVGEGNCYILIVVDRSLKQFRSNRKNSQQFTP